MSVSHHVQQSTLSEINFQANMKQKIAIKPYALGTLVFKQTSVQIRNIYCCYLNALKVYTKPHQCLALLYIVWYLISIF